MPPDQLEIVPAPLGGVPGIALAGEIDIAVAPQVSAALDEGARTTDGAFVVDLCDVEFLDSSGVTVLVRARAVLGRDDRELVVICPPGPVRRIFEVAGIVDLLALYASRDEAASALVPAE